MGKQIDDDELDDLQLEDYAGWQESKRFAYEHACAVVSRIVNAKEDITFMLGADWTSLACSLAMFGDKGKSLFIDVSKVNKEATDELIEKKWSWALKNSRIKTIGKLLKLAKEKGVDTSIPNTEDLDPSKFLPAEAGQDGKNDLEEYGFFSMGNCYYSMRKSPDGNGYRYAPYTNFVMKILYHIHDKKTPRRFVELVNIRGHRRAIPAPTDSLNTSGNFKKFIEGQGNFIWEGSEVQFMKLKRKLFDQEKSCVQLETLGWANSGYYSFSNGVLKVDLTEAASTIKPSFIPVDENGVLQVDGKNIFIPAGNSAWIDDEFMHQAEKKFKFIETALTFERWTELFVGAYGDPGKIAMCYNIACLFSDIIFSRVKGFPMMYFYGEGGSGKGSLIKSCMHLYGDPQSALTLTGKANTDKAKIRKFAQFKNSMMMLEEFSNTLSIDSIMMLRGLWDRMGYERSVLESKFGTENVPINSGVGITGNDYPQDDPLLQRLIVAEMNANQFNAKTKKAFNDLDKEEQKGISGILMELVPLRGMFVEHFEADFIKAYNDIKPMMGKENVTERMVKNVAAVAGAYAVVSRALKFSFEYEDLTKSIAIALKQQNSKRNTGGEITKWWDCFVFLLKNRRIRHNREFTLEGNQLKLRYNEVHSEYLFAHTQLYRTAGLGKASMLDKIKNSDCFDCPLGSTRIGETNTSAYVFKYDKIGVDLITLISYIKSEEEARRGSPELPIIENPEQKADPNLFTEPAKDAPFA